MRLDIYLVEKGFAESRQKAQRLIKGGCVSVEGQIVDKPSADIDESLTPPISVAETENERYVSRGGLKLEGALKEFKIDPRGLVCADIGASTGGFTDCLLQNGAKRVYAFDSGSGQLHRTLVSDERVISRENFNARFISPEDVEGNVALAVMDVSFISQTLILPNLSRIISPGGILITLVKPQFEAGRSALGKNGIVKRKEDRLAAVLRVLDSAAQNGMSLKGLINSPIRGGDGNEEFLACFSKTENNETVGYCLSDIKKTVFG